MSNFLKELPCGRWSSLRCEVVRDEELTIPFIRDVKSQLRQFSQEHGITYHTWQDQLMNLYCDYPGKIVDENGNEVYLKTIVFEVPSIRYWFRDQLKPCRIPSTYLRKESMERFIILATILKAYAPERAKLWGK